MSTSIRKRNIPAEDRTTGFAGKSLPFSTGKREGGVLLHVTSLHGPFGIGDLGPAAYEWIDRLAEARQTWWQILPLGPTAAGDSPYQCLSAFAGNPLLISPELLAQDGLIAADDRTVLPSRAKVDFKAVRNAKSRLLRTAFENFRRGGPAGLKSDYDVFVDQTFWLNDFARFMAITNSRPGECWTDWPKPLRDRKPAAIVDIGHVLADEIAFHQFAQFIFFRQLAALRRHAHQHGVGLIGDVPIFIGHHSADVWASPHLFQLQADGRPKAVAGVPPDAFSADGQCWNNPLYDWPEMAKDDYTWWTRRMAAAFEQTDAVRLDHFRGFEAYWRIPAGKPATVGRWVEGPGGALFEAMTARLGRLPLIAEDLGVITPAVEALRDDLNLPGMRVLQFGFGGLDDSIHLPHHIHRNTVAYTGTHDNDTTVGWFRSLGRPEQQRMSQYAGAKVTTADSAWALTRMAWASTAALAVVPAQDLLSLPSSARMNIPGTDAGNWQWRLQEMEVLAKPLAKLSALSKLYARG